MQWTHFTASIARFYIIVSCCRLHLVLITEAGWAEEFQILPENYSHQFHPWTSKAFEGTLDVQVYMTIVSITNVDEDKSVVHMSFMMRSLWIDPRLSLPEALKEGDCLSLSPFMRTRLWVPDFVIIHAQSLIKLNLYTPMEAFQVYSNKTVFVASLLLMEYTCPMKYSSYPLDVQVCKFFLESSGYPADRLNISWHPAGVSLMTGFNQHQFDVSVSSGFTHQTKYPSGTYSGVGFHLHLTRKVQFYLLQTYLPSALLVAVAGVSFLVPPSAVPGRMVLCITTLLAIITMFAAERQAGPRVNYVKAMDVWMLGCMVFTFYSTIEYALVIRLGLNQTAAEKAGPQAQSACAAPIQCSAGRRAKIVPMGQTELPPAACDNHRLAQMIEKWSLRAYGCLFGLFNLAYWLHYTKPKRGKWLSPRANLNRHD